MFPLVLQSRSNWTSRLLFCMCCRWFFTSARSDVGDRFEGKHAIVSLRHASTPISPNCSPSIQSAPVSLSMNLDIRFFLNIVVSLCTCFSLCVFCFSLFLRSSYLHVSMCRQTGGMNVDIISQLIGLPQTNAKSLYEQLRPLYVRLARRDDLPAPVVLTVPYYDDFAKGELTSTTFQYVRFCTARETIHICVTEYRNVLDTHSYHIVYYCSSLFYFMPRRLHNCPTRVDHLYIDNSNIGSLSFPRQSPHL